MLVHAARRAPASLLARSFATSARLHAPPVLGVPISLVTVNRSPERARSVLNEVIEIVQDKYTIKYGGNIETIEGLRPYLISLKPPPGILFCASMWSTEDQEEIMRIAHEQVPSIRTHAIPPGLWDKGGRQAVLDHLVEQIDDIMLSRKNQK